MVCVFKLLFLRKLNSAHSSVIVTNYAVADCSSFQLIHNKTALHILANCTHVFNVKLCLHAVICQISEFAEWPKPSVHGVSECTFCYMESSGIFQWKDNGTFWSVDDILNVMQMVQQITVPKHSKLQNIRLILIYWVTAQQ